MRRHSVHGETQRLRVNVGLSRKLSKDYNSTGYSINLDGGWTASIADAERLVVVGRGIGSKKNLPLMRRLAEALGAELGCTRPVVEAGWLECRHQIGQTGVSVSPKLLVSIGVSGAIQHLAGMQDSDCIIAINKDPQANIFKIADYGIVGDLYEVIPQIIKSLDNIDELSKSV
mgnify:CR=1 FL=1